MIHTKPQAILFDLDGTLVDTAPDFVRIIHSLCQMHCLPKPPADLIRAQVSAGATAMVRLCLSGVDKTQLLCYKDEFLQAYANNICVNSTLFLGMDDIIKACKDLSILWGIVTNKPRHLSEKLLTALKISPDVLVCADDVAHAKPNPQSLLLAAKTLNVAPMHCVYVGDHVRDVMAAKSAGMYAIAAAYGYVPLGENAYNWGADWVVDNVRALYDVLFVNNMPT